MMAILRIPEPGYGQIAAKSIFGTLADFCRLDACCLVSIKADRLAGDLKAVAVQSDNDLVAAGHLSSPR